MPSAMLQGKGKELPKPVATGAYFKTQNRRMQYFRRGEEKGGNAPRREPKAKCPAV